LLLNTFVQAMHRVTESAQYVPVPHSEGHAAWESNVRHHADLFQAIEASDPDAAEAVIRVHLNYIEGRMNRAITARLHS
jgi:DNA-binding FadR family transcriptional regulator